MPIFQQKTMDAVCRFVLGDVTAITDNEVLRKTVLMVCLFSIGEVMLLTLGTFAWFSPNVHDKWLGLLDYLVAATLFGLYFYLRKTRKHMFCCYTGVAVTTVLFWYCFMSGAGDGYAYLWAYTYPLFTLFLLGSSHGGLAILLFFLPCFGFLVIDVVTQRFLLYDLGFAVRFVPSFLTVSLFAFMFERVDEHSRMVLHASHAELEQRVRERTEELQREVDARKRNEDALCDSEQRYRMLFNSYGDGISIVSADSRFLEVNDELCDRLGYSRTELLQMTPKDINTPSSSRQVGYYVRMLFEEGFESVVFEGEQVCRDGEIVPVEFQVKRIIFNNQEAILVVCRDIRDRKKTEAERARLEAQLHRSQKMEVVGLMAGGVAHDLNNILTGVVTYPDLLLRQLPEDHSMVQPLQVIKESGKRASAVVADLLTVARGVAHLRVTANLNALIEEYISSPEHQALLAQHPEVTCETALSAEVLKVKCSKVHIKKSLMNLVFNAVEAIHGPGMVRIATRIQDMDLNDAVALHLNPGAYAVMVVSDTGAGISETDRQHIFEPFYTKKKMGGSGTGLGLAIVWNTVQDHEGGVIVESGDCGTAFSIYLPLTGGRIDIKDEDVALEYLKGRGELILVVDDDAMQREIIVKMLGLLGYSPTAVASGEEAVDFMERRCADLVLLDMLMEPGMNGYQTYAEIIKTHPGQKAVIASGYSESEDVVKAYQLGVNGFLKKPYTIEQLGVMLQQVFKG